MLLYGQEPGADAVVDEDRTSVAVDDGACAAVRERLEATLSAWGHDELADVAVLCASEITTVLLDVGCEALELAVLAHEDSITVELRCSRSRRRFTDVIAGDPAHARGLGMIDGIVSLWGVRPTGEGDAVWFQVR